MCAVDPKYDEWTGREATIELEKWRVFVRAALVVHMAYSSSTSHSPGGLQHLVDIGSNAANLATGIR